LLTGILFCEKAGIPGGRVTDECIEIMEQINSRKSKLSWAVFALQGEKQIVCEAHGQGPEDRDSEDQRHAAWEEFTSHFPEDDIRYGAYQFSYLSPTDNVVRGKTIFVMWVGPRSKPKKRMMATMYAKSVSRQLSSGMSFQVSYQANDTEDLAFDAALTKILSRATVK